MDIEKIRSQFIRALEFGGNNTHDTRVAVITTINLMAETNQLTDFYLKRLYHDIPVMASSCLRVFGTKDTFLIVGMGFTGKQFLTLMYNQFKHKIL